MTPIFPRAILVFLRATLLHLFFVSALFAGNPVADGLLKSGRLHLGQKNVSEARVQLEKLKENYPGYPGIAELEEEILKMKHGLLLEMKRDFDSALGEGKMDKAIAAIDKYLKAFPEDTEIQKLKTTATRDFSKLQAFSRRGIGAVTYSREGKIEKRVASTEELEAEEFYQKGLRLFEEERLTEAAKFFTHASELAPNNPGYRKWIQDCREKIALNELITDLRKNRLKYSRDILVEKLKQILFRDPFYFEYRMELAEIYQNFNEHQAAIKEFKTILSQEPELRRLIREKGDNKRLRSLAETLVRDRLGLVRSLSTLDLLDEAWNVLSEIPSEEIALRGFGMREIYYQYFEIYSRKYFIYFYLTCGFLGLGLVLFLFQAVVLFRFHKEFPLPEIFRTLKVYWLIDRGNFREALEELTTSFKTRLDGHHDLELLYLQGLLELKLGKTSEAHQNFNKCISVNQQFSRGYVFAGGLNPQLDEAGMIRMMKKGYIGQLKDCPSIFSWLFPENLEKLLLQDLKKGHNSQLGRKYMELAMASVGYPAELDFGTPKNPHTTRGKQ